MRKLLLKHSGPVNRAMVALTESYRPGQLHTLRVGIRRIRSLLKQVENPRSRRFRQNWGTFATVTNEARDWDVFVNSARKLLSASEMRTFRRLNRERIEASHDAVRLMLRSRQWKRHIHDWKGYIEPNEGEYDAHNHPQPRHHKSLQSALEKANVALTEALASDDDASWHRFRITLKVVRYIAEVVKPRSAEIRQLIDTCKALQSLLGNWHDTVIQTQMLNQLEAAPVHTKLVSMIALSKVEWLSQTRGMLATQTCLVPKSSDASTFHKNTSTL